MQRGGKEGEGNRFEVPRNLNNEAEGENNGKRSGEEGNGRRGGSQGMESESVEMAESDNGTGNSEGRGEANRKRTLETRSPGTHLDSRVSRLRMDELELGEIFEEVNKYWREGSKDLIDKAPEGYRQELKSGMDMFLDGMKKIMDGVSDKVTLERRKREAGEMNMVDKLGKIEDKIKDIQRKNDNVMTDNIQDKVKASGKEMEKKLQGAMKTLKLTDIDFGEATQDRTRLVRAVTNRLRGDVHPDDRAHFDRILRRTRIQILGKGTEKRRDRSKTINTVPVLLECAERADAWDMDSILKHAGYFSAFHWPKEAMEFVNGIRDDVRRNGCSEQDYYVKVRPEDRGGEIRIRADVKEKNGGRWQMKAIWSCPPINRDFWALNEDLYAPVVVGGGLGVAKRKMPELATDGAQVSVKAGGKVDGKGGSEGIGRVHWTVFFPSIFLLPLNNNT